MVVAVLCLIKLSNLPSFGVSGIDKYVHFTFHFIFTLLWGSYYWLNQKTKALKPILKVVLASLLYGILLEILQETCTVARHADIMDVLANLTGALTALVVFIILKKAVKKEIH
jgi:VanZ family protein